MDNEPNLIISKDAANINPNDESFLKELDIESFPSFDDLEGAALTAAYQEYHNKMNATYSDITTQQENIFASLQNLKPGSEEYANESKRFTRLLVAASIVELHCYKSLEMAKGNR